MLTDSHSTASKVLRALFSVLRSYARVVQWFTFGPAEFKKPARIPFCFHYEIA